MSVPQIRPETENRRARKGRNADTRSTRIEARITPENLTVIRRAAEIQGRSVSDFVIAAAQEAAYKAIENSEVIRLTVEQHQQFMDAILNPPPLAPAMERAIQRHRELVGDV